MEEVEINKLEGVIEAILFTMGESVELNKIAAAIEHDEETTRKIIHRMMDKYDAEDRGVRIIELEDAFQMCTKTQMYEYLIRVAKQPKKYVLTDVLLETLSIIAYKQPVTFLRRVVLQAFLREVDLSICHLTVRSRDETKIVDLSVYT